MYLLYLDEAGSISDPGQKHFVLAGVAVFERKTHWVEQSLNAVAARFCTSDHVGVELHGAPMRGGSGRWRGFPVAERIQAIKDALGEVQEHGLVLFGVAVNKQRLVGEDPVEHAFEQIASRFDLFLRRKFAKYGDAQRGLILFDKSTTEMRIQTLARDFKYSGHSWGQLKNFAEVPVFLDSKSSRLIQMADLVAYALYRSVEHGDESMFSIIQDSFDNEGGVVHGLYYKI